MASRVTRRSRPSRGPAIPPPVLALGTVAILVVAGVMVMGSLNPPPENEGDEGEAAGTVQAGSGAKEEEPVDPFAGLPPEAPPAERRHERLDREAETAPGEIEPGSVLDVPAWRAIVAVSEEAKRALREATEQRGGGDLGAYRKKAKAAKALYEDLVDKTREFRAELRASVGTDDRSYRRVDTEYARWTDVLLAIKKDAGL